MTPLSRVFIERIKLGNFRNYRELNLELDYRHVVLTGLNGAGKTNLLEAVSFLSPGRGMRRANYDSIAGKGRQSSDWSIFCELKGARGLVSIGTGVQSSALTSENVRKTVIDNTRLKSSEELLEHSRIVWLIPAMDGLFMGPANERRRYLDRLVLAIDPGHARRVTEFEKTMRARNKLLSEDYPDGGWLDAIETQMAQNAVAIATARVELANLLSRVIVESASNKSPFPDAIIHLDGYLEALINEISAGDLELKYARELRGSRRIDSAAGRTLNGPHRSDMKIDHRPKSMPAKLCSTGEQKALLIGLLLAHARLAGELHGFAPVLLLDEIVAHLDKSRRQALFDMIDQLGCQAWMSGTDREMFDALGQRAKFLTVEDGKIFDEHE